MNKKMIAAVVAVFLNACAGLGQYAGSRQTVIKQDDGSVIVNCDLVGETGFRYFNLTKYKDGSVAISCLNVGYNFSCEQGGVTVGSGDVTSLRDTVTYAMSGADKVDVSSTQVDMLNTLVHLRCAQRQWGAPAKQE